MNCIKNEQFDFFRYFLINEIVFGTIISPIEKEEKLNLFVWFEKLLKIKFKIIENYPYKY